MGAATLRGIGQVQAGSPLELQLDGALPNVSGWLVVGETPH
ncbi:MAG: hypothetical protein R3E96_15950 [Planctomycetota bacterium]